MIALTHRPGSGPRGVVPFLIKLASHCGKNVLQKSSTVQKVSTSRLNMLTSDGMVVSQVCFFAVFAAAATGLTARGRPKGNDPGQR
jgi:hypothetical protein